MRAWLPLLLVSLAAACGDGSTGDDHDGHDRDSQGHASHEGDGHDHDGHVHAAPRGGALVVLQEEGAHVEFLRDPESGHVSMLVLGAHAEKPVRVAQESVTLSLDVAGEAAEVELPAVASDLTGETVGDTSEFAAVVPGLKGTGTFSGSIASITVRGVTYTDVRFSYP